jgi:hypothetical protein
MHIVSQMITNQDERHAGQQSPILQQPGRSPAVCHRWGSPRAADPSDVPPVGFWGRRNALVAGAGLANAANSSNGPTLSSARPVQRRQRSNAVVLTTATGSALLFAHRARTTASAGHCCRGASLGVPPDSSRALRAELSCYGKYRIVAPGRGGVSRPEADRVGRASDPGAAEAAAVEAATGWRVPPGAVRHQGRRDRVTTCGDQQVIKSQVHRHAQGQA